MNLIKLPYAANPYLPGKEHVPDGEPHIFGNRLYVFGSHDEVGANRYCTGSYVGWSAPLDHPEDWRYEGVILEKGQDPMDPNGDRDYYAPDVTQGSDGRYYLYYSIENSMVISVAVADEPAGKYKFYGYVKSSDGHILGSQAGDGYQFDPAVLKDDDGRYYLYSGQSIPILEINGRKVRGSMVCELGPDMCTVIGQQRTITSDHENRFSENPFFEASSIRKIRGRYYFIYSPLPNTHLLCYAVSDHPDRDFVYQGVLVSNADIFAEDAKRREAMNYWGNNHGSIVEMNHQYYVFYHRNTNRSPYARQGCAEKILLTEDGRFHQAGLTSNGLYGKPFPAKNRYPAYIAWRIQKANMPEFKPYRLLEYDESDPYIAEEEETDIPYVANMRDRSRVGFRYFLFDGTERNIIVSVRGKGSGKLMVRADDEIIAEIPMESWDGWKAIASQCGKCQGRKSLLMTYEGEGAIDFLNFEFR